ncbi:MAG: YbhB/YbcL family Raf kinase inhibitor-like protein [Chromatiales bacterium]|nr:YbhB/YbcL family Raf kinase inhibitor-like protein [Chromatiales bacterium]
MIRHLAVLLALAGLATGAQAGEFRLGSPDIGQGRQIAEAHVYDGFGCSGGNISPELSWENVPEGTRSFALMVHDPDAPTGSGWWHWVVWNLPADLRSLARDAGVADGSGLPAGAVQGRTDFGGPGYGGPCPPEGADPHRYHFRLHALSVAELDLPADATAAFVGFNVNAHTIEVAELVPVYSR